MAEPTPRPLTSPDGVPLSRRAIREAERATGEIPVTPAIAPLSSLRAPEVSPEPAAEPEPRDLLAAPDPAKPSRAGRNLPMATVVGTGLGGLILATLFVRKEAFVVLAVVACVVGLWELERAVRTRDIRIPFLPLAVGTVGMLVSAYTAGVEALLVAFVLTAGGVFVWRVLDGGGVPALRDATAGIFAAAYIPFLAGFVMIMLSADDGAWRVLTFLALVVANDVGGYTAGVLFGKHPLAPSVSPKKSWEGTAGSSLLAASVGLVAALTVLDAPWWAGVGLGLVAVVGSTVGDLAESLLKRDLGVKDMGTLLPGHGGIMDRLDSLLPTAPIAWLLLAAFVPYPG